MRIGSISGLVSVSGFIFGARLFGAVCSLAAHLVLARWLGAESFGSYVLAMALAGVLSAVLALGFPAIANRFVAQYRTSERSDLLAGFIRSGRMHLIVTSLVFVPAVIAGLIWLPLDLSPAQRYALVVGSLIAPVLATLWNVGSLTNAFHHHILASIPDLVARPALFLIAVWAVITIGAPQSVTAFLQVHLLVALLVATLALAYVRHRGIVPVYRDEPQFETALWRNAALPMTLVFLFTAYFAELDILLLGFFLPPEQLAIFSVSVRLMLVVEFVVLTVYRVSAPTLAEAQVRGDFEEVRTIARRANCVVVAGAGVALVLALGFGHHVLALFGAEFTAGYAVLCILLAGQVVRGFFGPAIQVLTVAGMQNYCLAALSIGGFFLPIGNFFLVPAFGIVGAGVAIAFASILCHLAAAFIARWKLGIDTVSFWVPGASFQRGQEQSGTLREAALDSGPSTPLQR